MEPLPACSEFDYEQNYELFRYIDGIIVMHATPEGNATLTEKITWGPTRPMALINIWNDQRAL